MASIVIESFGGINTEVNPRISNATTAQKAHNCLLWDGALRPLAKWKRVEGVEYDGMESISLSDDNVHVYSSALKDATRLEGDFYPLETTVGLSDFYYSVLDSNIAYVTRETPTQGREVSVHRPRLLNSSGVSYSRAFKSDKPVNRLYAVSAIRRTHAGVEESTLALIPNQSPQGIIYEGDEAAITINIESIIPNNATGIRLYRSITGLDTGTSVGNELDTEFYLIHEFQGTPDGINYDYTYIDGGSATTDPLDLYLAGRFYPARRYMYRFLQVTEGGYVAAASEEGDIVVSERYLYHAWPTENYWKIPDKITDFKAQFDTLFIGTANEPYLLALSPGEQNALQGAVTRFPERYECLPHTMDATPAGAVYASPSGIVTLSREGMRLVSAGVGSGVRELITRDFEVPDLLRGGTKTITTRFRFQHTAYGAYYKGNYFGFCRQRLPDPPILEQ